MKTIALMVPATFVSVLAYPDSEGRNLFTMEQIIPLFLMLMLARVKDIVYLILLNLNAMVMSRIASTLAYHNVCLVLIVIRLRQ